MEAASPGNASAKLDGKARIAEHATNKSINACLVALTTVITIWKLARASASNTGLAMTVRKLFAV
jgi:hypothetical protein